MALVRRTRLVVITSTPWSNEISASWSSDVSAPWSNVVSAPYSINISAPWSSEISAPYSFQVRRDGLFWFQVFCGSISSLRCEYSWRYRAEVGKLVRRLAVRASGPDAVALMQASCARTQTLRLRHGASDWETASGGLGSSWKGGPGFVRATADATKRVPPDLRLSTFLAFPCRSTFLFF